uniref:ribosomal protein L13 n=1 Tax=Pseudoerythrocladia kornmannii TaxID=753682 RepID=UPI001BF085B9|nr:ribosomal protein L13 [Pseudoerythrocladia kornmannii]QUE28281.1 ribosomal protein L13 [Pseudoerythrocladia kornmannii]UNJ16786.1 ribosomal protein L13 [Pseudoerythrocladia kornmannii]
MNKTIFPQAKKAPIINKWLLIDAKEQNLGRLATIIANNLRGKKKSIYTPHADTGDFIIVINADKIEVTGKKLSQKKYYNHSGRPGGMKIETMEQLKNRIPTRIVEKAVKGMLPKGPLGRSLFKKLKVYSGSKHPHVAQSPEIINLV